ncbi:XRE family transcriptional regulator [Burkholderia glumae]|uniref:XRE family transcriptional regulator n=1 Tax=Burkholderia glumae TaxID=337 RepID=UPI0001A4B4DE|nr:XRE family transcriptional regulator [Burkholderia glumae]ACR29200.1 Putative phage repressor [Burkholderia glumae BGR1]
MDIGSRIREKRLAHGLTLQQVGDMFGISRSAVASWERGATRPDQDKLPRLARILKTSIAFLLSGERRHDIGGSDSPTDDDEVTEDNGYTLDAPPLRSDIVQISRFDTGGAMGSGIELRDQPGIIETLRVSHEWINKNLKNYSSVENLCVVTGFGDSMRPMFNPGDPLIIDVGIKLVEYDAIYFFRVDGEGFIKRLQRIPTEGGLVLRARSENASYETWDITPRMNFEVLGRVLKVWRSEDF